MARHALALLLATCALEAASAFHAPNALRVSSAWPHQAMGRAGAQRGGGCASGLRMQGKPRPGAGNPVRRIRSYYDVLGVQKKVGTDEIRRAYTDKAKVCHPDVGGDPEQFMLINQAYEALMDPDSRARYDAQLFAAYAQVTDARLTEPMTRAQMAIVAVAGGAAAAPVVIPLSLAKLCVEPFASSIPAFSGCF